MRRFDSCNRLSIFTNNDVARTSVKRAAVSMLKKVRKSSKRLAHLVHLITYGIAVTF